MAEEEVVHSTIVELIIKAVDEITEPIEHAEKQLRGLIGDLRELAASGFELFAGYEMMSRLIEPAAAMQEKMTDLQIATDANSEKLKEFKERAEDLSTTYGQTAEVMVASQTTLSRMFGDTEKALKASDIVAKYAMVTHQSAAVAAQGLATAYETIGNKTLPFSDGLQDVADRLTYLQTKFELNNISAQAFGRMFANISGEAEKFHLPLDQLEAMAAVLTRVGYQGARSVMIVRQAMDTVFGGAKGFGESWAKFGLMVGKDQKTGVVDFIATLEHAYTKQHAAFEKFVQAHGQSGIVLEKLVHQLEGWKAATEGVDHAHGELNKDAELMQANWLIAYQNFKNSVDNLADAIGTELLPFVTELVIGITRLIDGFKNFAEAHPIILKVVAAVTTLIAGLLTLAGIFGMTVGFLAMVVTSLGVLEVSLFGVLAPMLVAAAGFAALAGIIYLHWPQIVRLYDWGVNTVRYFMDLFNRNNTDTWDTVRATGDKNATWVDLSWASILSTTKKYIAQLKEVAPQSPTWFAGLKSALIEVQDLFGTMFGVVSPEQHTKFLQELAKLDPLEAKRYKEEWGGFTNFWHAAFGTSIAGLLETTIMNPIMNDIKRIETLFDSMLDYIVNSIKAHIPGFKALTDLFEQAQNYMHLNEATGVHNPPGYVPPNVPTPDYPKNVIPPGLRHPTSYMSGGPQPIQLNYQPTVNITAGPGGDVGTVQDGLDRSFRDHTDEIQRVLEEHRLNQNRTTFSDLVYNT